MTSHRPAFDGRALKQDRMERGQNNIISSSSPSVGFIRSLQSYAAVHLRENRAIKPGWLTQADFFVSPDKSKKKTCMSQLIFSCWDDHR